ncbi:MAG: ketol-acid reductoisomerase, partial [Gammaproteobacteria bacterium]|nr:ketol-acid reductoisomerase [Gammaproteobacteria bacterium]
MKVYYDNDADLSIIQSKRVAIIGFGSQGHAHAGNLQDSGVDVVVGLRADSASRDKAAKAGIAVADVSEAVANADVVMMLVPDELQASLYESEVAPNLKSGAAITFAHGFNIHFGFIDPADDIDTFMVAPKGPGHLVRSTYASGGGVPCLIAL